MATYSQRWSKKETNQWSPAYPAIRSGIDDVDSEIMREYCEESVDQPNTGDRGQEDEPEVKEDVDLLIDDVQRENTQSVVVLN